MISDVARECFVYVTLPERTEPVAAGRFELRLDRRGVPEGRFIYARSYLARGEAVPLDPVELKLSERIYTTNGLGGAFGALRDASPDYWGRRVIQTHRGDARLSELDYLLYSPDDRAGALGFGLNQVPPPPKRSFNQTLDLAQVQQMADAIIADGDVLEGSFKVQVENLLLAGTSMGGARPKAVVEDEAGLWVAKFNVSTDAWNSARVEHAMLLLGRACGLTTAQSRVVNVAGRDVLLVKRFDREKTASGYLRARMVSALTLLRAEDTYQARDRWSYMLLAEELRRACRNPVENTIELFRRMCFNALISNIDDHPRNHALIAGSDEWNLSPAYDLTPSVPVSIARRDLAMTCGDSGRFANAANLFSQSARFLLEKEQATAIVDTMEARVKSLWFAIAREAGVSGRDCEKIAGAFCYVGFRQIAS
jgi:serine/threonine-protein kinase HipA